MRYDDVAMHACRAMRHGMEQQKASELFCEFKELLPIVAGGTANEAIAAASRCCELIRILSASWGCCMHEPEDQLRDAVLRHIVASTLCDAPHEQQTAAALARIALSTSDIDFARYYA